VVLELATRLGPSVERLRATLERKSAAFAEVIKVGRTHLQDATPLTLGQEISGWVAQLDHGLAAIRAALVPVHELAQGGTAVGTGLNAHPEFAVRIAAKLAELTGHPFVTAPNKFQALASHEGLVFVHGALKVLATGGMYLGGGIAPKALKTLQNGQFVAAFLDKGRLSPLLQSIPVRIILDQTCALLGAAAYAEARAAEISGRSERAASVTP